MSLYLLRFDPDLQAAARWFHAEKLAPRDQDDDGYAWHALLTAAFGPALAPKPFRLLARRGRPAQLLAYAAQDAAALTDHASGFADPLAHQALAVGSLAAKRMPDFAAGRRLGFSVRVRPTTRTDRGGDRTTSRELDAAVAKLGREGARNAAARADAYAQWIRTRLAAAGTLVERMWLDGAIGDDAPRRGPADAEGRRALLRIPGHSVTAAGTLRVEHADRFAQALARGIGRHRAFGYGMMLLSPPQD